MSSERVSVVRENLRRLVIEHREAMAAFEQKAAELDAELDELEGDEEWPMSECGRASLRGGPVIDRSRFSVSFDGRICFLGNTLSLRFLESLVRRCDRYVSHERLLVEVWEGGKRSDSTMRSVVRELRSKLRTAGMDDLSAAIDGRRNGHYGLILCRKK